MTREELRRLQRKNKAYWKRRELQQHQRLFDKTVSDLDKELGKQYRRTADSIKREILEVLSLVREESQNERIQPYDLYRGNRYFQMLADINQELEALGFQQIEKIEDELIDLYFKQSENTAQQFGMYSTVDKDSARKVVSELWCSDGKGLSDRIWQNKQWLVDRLETSIFDFVARGASTDGLVTEIISNQLGLPISELTDILDAEFKNAWNNARRLVRTETARVQNRATQDRYKEQGFTKYRVIAEDDCCEVCADLSTQVFDIDNLVLPQHPNCRCAMAAVTDSMK